MSTGVVLELKTPNAWAIKTVQAQAVSQRPLAPTTFIEAKGRSEVNESDPAYQDALVMYNALLVERTYEALILTGTTVKSVPDGFAGPDDTDWQERIEAMGIPVAPTKSARYIQWIKFIAAPDKEDWVDKLLGPLLDLLGTKEADVADAIDAFPGDKERGAALGDSANGSHSNGVGVREPAAGVGPGL